MKTRLSIKPLVIALSLFGSGLALADINIGVSASATGSAAVLGGPEKNTKPGTAEFRAALRDAIENEKKVPGVHGVFNMSPTDHYGLDRRARVLLQVQNGAFKMVSN